MAPSVQQLPEDAPVVAPEKVAAVMKEAPKVRRQIETEGGKTDAKVSSPAKL